METIVVNFEEFLGLEVDFLKAEVLVPKVRSEFGDVELFGLQFKVSFNEFLEDLGEEFGLEGLRRGLHPLFFEVPFWLELGLPEFLQRGDYIPEFLFHELHLLSLEKNHFPHKSRRLSSESEFVSDL